MEDTDDWACSKDTDSLDSDHSDSSSKSNEGNNEIVGNIVNCSQIHSDSNLPMWERAENEADEITIEQGKTLVATCVNKLVEDIDPLWL